MKPQLGNEPATKAELHFHSERVAEVLQMQADQILQMAEALRLLNADNAAMEQRLTVLEAAQKPFH